MTTTFLDPVCGMTVDETALRAEGHDDVAFCSPGCRTAFLADPAAFAHATDSHSNGDHEAHHHQEGEHHDH